MHERRITHQRKNKKEKPHDTFPPHQPASPRASSRYRPASNPLSTYCLPPLYTPPALPPIVTVPPSVSTPYSQLYQCLSRSRYRSPSTLLFRSLTVTTHAWLPTAHLYRLLSHRCLHTVHMSVCTIVLTLSCHHAATLGSGPVLTTGHRPHLLCVTPVTCATTSPLRESTLTPCRFHHPYRSLTLAHRVVPPLVVPVPSLAVSGVRLSFMVPLAGESPLADARLPPHPNGHLLLAKRSPTHHAPLLCQHPSCTHTCQHSCSHACYQFCPHHAYSTSSNPASITLRA